MFGQQRSCHIRGQHNRKVSGSASNGAARPAPY
jgi:hypothetical protein